MSQLVCNMLYWITHNNTIYIHISNIFISHHFAGTVGTHLAWQNLKLKQNKDIDQSLSESMNSIDSVILAGFGGCLFTRLCSRSAYNQHGRSMMTSNLIEQMQSIVHELYPIVDSKL